MAERKHIPQPLRDKLLVDAMNRCCLCPEHHYLTVDAHHIIPISEGGPDTEDNLMVVCGTCHDMIHRVRAMYNADQLRIYKQRWVALCRLGLPMDVRLAHAFDLGGPPPPAAAWIPLPPQPHFAHPYPLQDHFTGRREERRMLTEWLTTGAQSVFAYVALGGFGKSALTWAWVQRDVLGFPLPGMPDDPCDAECRLSEDLKPEGVLWWSFYEREAKFDAFLREALVYFSGGQIDPQSLDSDHDRVVALVALLQQHRFLLVLDGFERELRAYASLNASYQGDEVAEEAKGDHRACIDPRAADFLRGIAALPLKGRVLMTTRLFPKELEGHDGKPLPGCRLQELTALHPEDAVAFFHAQGIQGHRAEIEEACAKYGFHPLVLRLLAGVILNDPELPADIRAAEGYDPGPDLKAREHHILRLAYDALRPQVRGLLSRLAAFRGPVEYEAAKAISPFDNEGELKVALRELAGRGLLLFDRLAARHDLHPIVRGYAYGQLACDARGAIHAKGVEYAFWRDDPGRRIERIDDLAPVVELYEHLIGAARYDEAVLVLADRLIPHPLVFRFAASPLAIELLRALFPDGEDHPPRLDNGIGRTWALNALACTYMSSGHPGRAVSLFETLRTIGEERGGGWGLAVTLVNLAEARIQRGELALAEETLRRALPRMLDLPADCPEANAPALLLATALAYQGAYADASQRLQEAKERVDTFGAAITNYVSVVRAFAALSHLLLGDETRALVDATEAREMVDETARSVGTFERDLVRCEWLLGWSHVALAADAADEREDHLAEGERHLTEALMRCRKINLVEFEPDILLTWARWHRLKGNLDEARTQADEALHIADRCEYRLCQADIHNFLARLNLDAGNLTKAREHAEVARERAYCDGPPHYYKPAYEEAERLLQELATR